jgi:mRNA interferase HigB
VLLADVPKLKSNHDKVCNLKTFAYFCLVKVLVKKTILFYIKKYPMAETQLMIWYTEFSRHQFSNFNELKKVYGNASIVNNNRVVFNIKGNDFRLVISINFLQAASYVIWFGTHKEYDKIDVQTISFDTAILTNKK